MLKVSSLNKKDRKNERKCSVEMTYLSNDDKADIIASVFKKRIQFLKSLPAEEAKMEARQGLMKIGVVDEKGDLTAPYAALRNQYVQ